jgi:hypothetical protein
VHGLSEHQFEQSGVFFVFESVPVLRPADEIVIWLDSLLVGVDI